MRKHVCVLTTSAAILAFGAIAASAQAPAPPPTGRRPARSRNLRAVLPQHPATISSCSGSSHLRQLLRFHSRLQHLFRFYSRL